MTVDDTILVSIESVDDFADELYCRSDAAGPAFDNLRSAIHNLQNAFNDLHAEARDPESLINNGHNGGAYARRLTSLLEDSDVTLKQAKTVLEKHDNHKSNDVDGASRENHSESAEKAQEIEVVRADLVSQKLKIYNFLETVRIHNPRFKTAQALEQTTDSDQRRTMIQNKVDVVANRVFQRRRHGSPALEADEGEELWQEFKAELVKEGFANEVLHKNKEVLQAYIRDLESHRALEDGAPPSVRGLLECGTPGPAPMAVTPASFPMPNSADGWRPNDQVPLSNEGRRRIPTGSTSSAPSSLQLYNHPQPPAISIDSSHLRYEAAISDSSDSSDTESTGSSSPISSQTALISTQELLALDQREADKMAFRIGGLMRGPPPNYDISPGTSPNTRYRPLPPSGNMPQPYNEKAGGQYPGATARYSPPPPPPPYSSSLSPTSSSPPPPYPPSPTGPVSPSANFNLTVSRTSPGAPVSQAAPLRHYSQLAPDGRGNGIPLDATWTKIKRTLVSPVVLQRAGVRYEARPDFVAVLGKLTHDQIAEFARQTLEERNSRGGGPPPLPNNRRRSTGGRTFGDPPLDPSRTRGAGGRTKLNRDAYDDDSAWGGTLGGRSDWSDDERGADTYRSKRNKYTPSDYRPDNYRPNHEPDYDQQQQQQQDPRHTSKIYPFIVSPPASVNGDAKTSPSSTVNPKPILKNQNPHKVRFDKDGPREIWPGPLPEGVKQQQQRHRDERERERNSRARGHDRDRDRDRERDRDRDRDRDRNRDRDRMRERGEHHRSHRHRDRERDRDRDRDCDDRPRRSSSHLKETASAIGLGSAAATLISVLSEAVQYL